MSLLERQLALRADIAADDESDDSASPGMAIYRNAYRGRLLAALEVSFERTRRWVGEDSFTAAACHYVLTHPPRGWTLDAYGADFPDLLAALFVEDREVSELAWLEWQMQQAFAAPDRETLDPASLAQAGYGDDDWERLTFTMAAGFAHRPISTNCAALWGALAEGDAADFTVMPQDDGALLVWRSGLSPQFRGTSLHEGQAVTALADGARFGDIARDADPQHLGGWLASWLGDGLFSRATIAGDAG